MPEGTEEPDPGDVAEGEHHVPGPTGPLILDPRLLGLGVMTFCAAWAEGSANDWLALMMADDRGASGALAAAGFAIFATAMTVGRLVGTAVVTRLGRVRTLRVGAVVAAVGHGAAARGAGAGRRLPGRPALGAGHLGRLPAGHDRRR